MWYEYKQHYLQCQRMKTNSLRKEIIFILKYLEKIHVCEANVKLNDL